MKRAEEEGNELTDDEMWERIQRSGIFDGMIFNPKSIRYYYTNFKEKIDAAIAWQESKGDR